MPKGPLQAQNAAELERHQAFGPLETNAQVASAVAHSGLEEGQEADASVTLQPIRPSQQRKLGTLPAAPRPGLYRWLITHRLHLLAALFTLHIGRMAVPYVAWLMPPLLLGSLVIVWPIIAKHPRLAVRSALCHSVLVAGVAMAFIGGLVRTDTLPIPLRADARNLALTCYLFLCFGIFVESRHQFSAFLLLLLRSLSVLALGAALLGYVKFALGLAGLQPTWLPGAEQPMGSSLVLDYNLYALLLLTGVIAMLHVPWRGWRPALITGLAVATLMGAVLFTGSRRGLVAASGLSLAYIIIAFQHTACIRLGLDRRFLRKALIGYFSVLILVFGLGFLATRGLGHPEGARALRAIGLNPVVFRTQLALVTYRHASVIQPKLAFADFYTNFYGVGMPPADAHRLARTGLDSALGRELPVEITGRGDRWRFGWALFEAAPPWQQLTGQGFTYVEKYARHFKTPQRFRIPYDHPHNSLLAALLYSGVIGLGLYLALLTASTVLWLRLSKKLAALLQLLPISFVFAITTDFSFFTVPLFTVLVLLPFAARARLKIEPKKSTPGLTRSA